MWLSLQYTSGKRAFSGRSRGPFGAGGQAYITVRMIFCTSSLEYTLRVETGGALGAAKAFGAAANTLRRPEGGA